MAKYVYPAIFQKEEDGGYSISFPDVLGCYTQGETMQESLLMANDALCLMLYSMEEENKSIPEPSDPISIKTDEGSFVSLVYCDTVEYRKFYDNKAVKKTLTIPSWLNTIAEKENVNFSLVLQNGLKEYLHIEA